MTLPQLLQRSLENPPGKILTRLFRIDSVTHFQAGE